MKRLNRCKALLLAFLLCCAALLTGCHGAREQASFTVPEQFDESRNYEISFWAKNDTNKAQTDVYKKAISDFEALYPNIKVNLRLYTDYGKIYNDVITNISTDTTPNVCITYPDHIATYLTSQNSVVALDELFMDSKYGLGGSELRFDAPTQEEIVPQFLRECVVNDHYYALPYMRSTEACYVNVTMLEKLGYTLPDTLTWDFVWEVAEAATAQDDEGNYLINGQNVMIPFIYKSTDNMMIQMLKQKQADYSTADGEILIFNDTTRELLEQIAQHVKTGAFSTFKISSYPANFLNAGQCIFAVDSTAGATWMGSYAPLSDISEDKFVEFETAVRAIPQFDAEHPQMISQGPSVCIFNKADGQEVLASWLFAQFLLTNDVQIGYAQTEGYLPVTQKAQESEQYKDYIRRGGEDNDTHYGVKIEASKLLMENIGNTFVTPVFNGSTSLRDAAGQMIEDVVKSVRRKKDVNDAYIDELYENVTSLYRLDQISVEEGDLSALDLGPLPSTAKALIAAIALVWCLIVIYLGIGALRNEKKRKSVDL